jgi:hypothetical protein
MMYDANDRATWPVVKGRLGDPEPNPYANLTPEERVGMMWELTRTAWAFMGHPDIQPSLHKHITRSGRYPLRQGIPT